MTVAKDVSSNVDHFTFQLQYKLSYTQ